VSVNPSNPDFFVLGIAKASLSSKLLIRQTQSHECKAWTLVPPAVQGLVINRKLAQTFSRTAFGSGGDGASYRRFLIEPHYCGLKEYKAHVSISIRADRHRGNFPVLFRIFTGSTKALPFRGIMASRLPSMRVQPHFAQRPFLPTVDFIG
jgi:hypothetical protein